MAEMIQENGRPGERWDIKGRIALVTGASKRLGRAIALDLARRGARIAAHCASSLGAAEDLAGEICQNGGTCQIFPADFDCPENARELVRRVAASMGTVSILINNASIFDEQSFSEMSLPEIERNLRINAWAPMETARAMAETCEDGVIINLLDTRVLDYDRTHVPYHLSKRMLATLNRIMALEFAPRIRVNAIAPGLVLPPEGKDDSYLAALAPSVPLQTWGGTQDIVDAVIYLIQARFVTGQTLYIDGGRHMKGHVYE